MKKILLLIPAVFLILGSVFYYTNFSGNEEIPTISEEIEFVTVELQGEVIFSGEYKVVKGSTLKHVIDLAYGFTIEADISNLNLNKKLEKNEVIVIPKIISVATLKININKANFADLLKVPNITEKRAASILVYREQYGLFKSIEELLNVKYIGIQTYDKIKDYFFV